MGAPDGAKILVPIDVSPACIAGLGMIQDDHISLPVRALTAKTFPRNVQHS